MQPPSGYRANDWNQIELILDANIIRPFLNEGGSGGAGGVAEESFGSFGPIALYVGGSGEVRFKDVSYKDLGVKTLPQEKTSNHFRMQRIDDFYYAWSAAAADFNHDGVMDVAAGPYYYIGSRLHQAARDLSGPDNESVDRISERLHGQLRL